MALTQISTQGIKDGTITGTDLATNVDLVDNQKLRLGTGNDLEILHNSSENHFNFSANTFFKGNSGWGVRNASNQNILQINGSNRTVELYGGSVRVISTASAKLTVRGGIDIENSEFNMTTNGNKILDFETGGSNFVNFRHNPSDSSNTTFMKAIHGGAVELYHDADGSKKFETDTNGITVTGRVLASGTSNIGFAGLDNVKLSLGTSDDLQIYHTSANSHINHVGTGGLFIDSSGDTYFRNTAGDENRAIFKNNGAVELYFDNSKKFETRTGGVTITGSSYITGNDDHPDNSKARFGTSDDLQIYHDGAHSYLDNSTGSFFVRGDTIKLRGKSADEDLIEAFVNGSVRLYHNNSIKLETTSQGIEVTSNSTAVASVVKSTGSARADVRILAEGTGEAYLWMDASNGDLSGADYAFIQHKNSTLDLIIANYAHDIILKTRNGSLGSGGLNTAIHCHENGAAELYHDNTKRIFTESAGGAISGKSRFLGHSQGSGANSTEVHFNSDNSHIGIHFSGHGNTGNTYTAARMVINGTGGTYGTITYSLGGTGYNSQSSDSRSKKNIVEWTESELDKFKNLQPKLFHFDHNEDSDPKYKGYIAQDNLAAFPEAYPLVDDRYMFNPSGMVHYLMKAMQELVSKVEVLETEVAALKAS
jgi:hypothetical protein